MSASFKTGMIFTSKNSGSLTNSTPKIVTNNNTRSLIGATTTTTTLGNSMSKVIFAPKGSGGCKSCGGR